MTSEASSLPYASSSSHSMTAPKELLQVLNDLNEKQKLQCKSQRKGQEMQQHQHFHYQYQYHHQYKDEQQYGAKEQQQDREQWEQQQLEESERKGEQKQCQKHMEWSQIELIYRAEGNANLVLALPQFKKVLRLPKTCKQHKQLEQLKPPTQNPEIQCCRKSLHKHDQPQGQPKQPRQQDKTNQQETNKNLTAGQQESNNDAVGILTMDHYVAYIGIIRCLVGNEFVFEADIVAVPNPTDRHWINEHIKPHRPANRLDKEFGGHFGLLLPDATQLPADFDILLSNLQPAVASVATATSQCSGGSSSSSGSSKADNKCSASNNIFGSDTFAIEIKPKQGWLLPNDVNNLFDRKTTTEEKIIKTIQPPSLRETRIALKAAVAKTIPKETDEKILKTTADIEGFTTVQNQSSASSSSSSSLATTTLTAKVGARATKTSQSKVTMNTRCSGSVDEARTTTLSDAKISDSLYDKVDTKCRYCCMQFLKLQQQQIFKRNQYCPIDLFSGCHEKMLLALQALFECPQNNLRVFQNGNLVFDDLISRTSKIEDLFTSDTLQLIKQLLVTCLLREYDNKGETKSCKGNETEQQPLSRTTSISATGGEGEGNRAGVAAGQPQSSVTLCKKQKLNTMSKTVTPITATTGTTAITTRTTTTVATHAKIELTKVISTVAAAEAISTMDGSLMSTSDNSTLCLEEITKAEMTRLPKNCVLQKILHLQTLAKIHLQFMFDHGYADVNEKTYNILSKMLEKFAKAQNSLSLSQLSPEEQYTLAATALDCSIMITFCKIENVDKHADQKAVKSFLDNPVVVSLFGQTYLTKVTLLDLDPKPDTHFKKYVLQTNQIADALKDH